jgi:hypothetical protein
MLTDFNIETLINFEKWLVQLAANVEKILENLIFKVKQLHVGLDFFFYRFLYVFYYLFKILFQELFIDIFGISIFTIDVIHIYFLFFLFFLFKHIILYSLISTIAIHFFTFILMIFL